MKLEKILIIDDNEEMCDLMGDFLNEKGYKVITANNPESGLAKAKEENPNMIVLDIFMHRVNGLDVLKALNSDAETSKIPIIVLSVLAEANKKKLDPNSELRFGVIDWIDKPVNFAKFIDMIKNIEKMLNLKEKRIAIMEDDINTPSEVSNLLKSLGYNPVRLSPTDKFSDKLLSEKPILVLSETNNSGKSSFDIIKELKSSNETADIPVIVLSESKLSTKENVIFLSGHSYYHTGSFNPETLLNEVRSTIIEYEFAQSQKYAKILVADDEKDLTKLAVDNLKVKGFEVVYAEDGHEALSLIRKEMPDLILLDINMPKKDGYEVMKELKEDVLINNIPVIMLTARSKIPEKILGMNLGADDYIAKPYDVDELIARVKMVLRRTFSNIEANPLTRLPGNISIERKINNMIKKGDDFAVLYVDINNFKQFNDHYGFSRGDDVIRTTARIILESIKELGFQGDFVGHIGGDDFIIITNPDRAEPLCELIINKYDKTAPSLYDEEDRKKGYITAKDRHGNTTNFGYVSVAIGVVTTKHRIFSSIGEVSKIGSEMKSHSKQFKKDGSMYSIDKRTTIDTKGKNGFRS